MVDLDALPALHGDTHDLLARKGDAAMDGDHESRTNHSAIIT